MKKRVREYLEEKHSNYCHYNQSETDCNVFMKKTGHPNASLYSRYRKIFDSLKYSCNSGARYFSYKNSDEYSEYWKPELNVTWRPSDIGNFYHVYPAMGQQWDLYLEKCAELGYPKGCVPKLDSGSWIICTKNKEFSTELKLLGFETSEGDYHRIYYPNYKTFYATIRLIKKYHRGFVLPKRNAKDEVFDQAEVPLKYKSVMTGNCKTVTVDAHTVLVPLIPLNSETNKILTDTVNKLADLVVKGLPYSEMYHWMKGLVSERDIKKVENYLTKKGITL